MYSLQQLGVPSPNSTPSALKPVNLFRQLTAQLEGAPFQSKIKDGISPQTANESPAFHCGDLYC